MNVALPKNISHIVAENELLRERVRQLETALIGDGALPPNLPHLTPSQEIVLRLLMGHDLVSRDMLMAALYDHRRREMAGEETALVFLKQLRARLKPLGIEIRNDYGRGWFLPNASRERLAGVK